MNVYEYLRDYAVAKIVDNAEITGGLKTYEQLATFIDVVQQKSPVLDEVRLERMKSFQKEIAAISTPTGYLYPGRIEKGGQIEKVIPGESENTSEFSLAGMIQQNMLDAKEFVLVASIDFDTLEDTIEGPDFEQRIVEMMGQSAALDLERAFLFGDKDLKMPATANPILKALDGWIKRAGVQVYGYDRTEDTTTIPKDFDPAAAAFPVNMFDAMLDAIDKKYLVPRRDLRFYVDWKTYSAYREHVMSRETALGDEVLTGETTLSYDGIPVVPVPSFDDPEVVELEGRKALLSKPDNMVWGVYREIGVEAQRIPRKRVVEHVLTVRTDCQYADRYCAVTANINQPA